MSYKMSDEARTVKVSEVNKYWTCGICKGYLCEATKIKECMHSFCKSCIVLYLEKKNTCPKCGILIHQSHPLNYIALDRHLQDIINRAFPYVAQKEAEREKEFYSTRGFANPNEEKKPSKKENTELEVNKENVNKIQSVNDWIFFGIEPCDESLPKLNFSYVKFPIDSTIGTLKKFISSFLFNNQSDAHKIDILLGNSIMPNDTSLKFAYVTHWKLQPIGSRYIISYRRSSSSN